MSGALVIRFTVEGRPVPKGRPRVVTVTRASRAHAYTPASTKVYETLIGWTYREPAGALPPATGLIALFVKVYEDATQHAGDLDNYVKIVGDALNGIAWADDKQVVILRAEMHRNAGRARLEVGISEDPTE